MRRAMAGELAERIMSATRNSSIALLVLAVLSAVQLSHPPRASADTTTPAAAAAGKKTKPTYSGAWTVQKFPADQQQGPMARLIRTPDTSGGQPPYALTDQTGQIQRFVEPVPGIDLEPYVGYVVVVGHDTGRTLLASQLVLPGTDSPALPANFGASRASGASMTEARDNWPNASAIQPVQYQQPVPGQQYMAPPGMMPIDPSGQMMMAPPPGGAPPMMSPDSAPIYLDGPTMVDSSQAGNVWIVPGTCQQPCPQCQQMPYQPMQCQQPCPQACPPPQPQPLLYSVFGEVLWLHPTGVDMAHAQQQNGIGGAGTVPWGQIGTADPDYDLGYRLGGEIRLGMCESVFGSYTFFTSNAKSTVIPPVIPGGGGAVGSLVQHPGADLTASDGPVNANYDIDFQLGDIAYRQILSSDPRQVVSFFLGGRFGHLDQDFRQTGVFAGGDGGTINTKTNIDIDAAGPMIGLDAEHQIGCSRFSVYGRGLVAALTGQFDSHYTMYNATTDELLAESVWKDDRIIPMLDYELGVAWTGPNRHFRLAAGYMASYWFNIVSTPTFVDAVQADNYVNVSDTLSFDGLVGHVEFRW
jgi:Legionella pneumophila major outer membrane protein precursor